MTAEVKTDLSGNGSSAPDLSSARAAIAAERESREKVALEEVNAIMKKYNCLLAVEMMISGDGRIVSRVLVAAANETRPGG